MMDVPPVLPRVDIRRLAGPLGLGEELGQLLRQRVRETLHNLQQGLRAIFFFGLQIVSFLCIFKGTVINRAVTEKHPSDTVIFKDSF